MRAEGIGDGERWCGRTQLSFNSGKIGSAKAVNIETCNYIYKSVTKYKLCFRLNFHMTEPYYKIVHSWINHFANVKMEYSEKCVWEPTMVHNSYIKSTKISTKLGPT